MNLLVRNRLTTSLHIWSGHAWNGTKNTIDDAIGSLQGLVRSLCIAGRTGHVSEDVEAALGRLVGEVALIENMLEEQEPMEEEPKSMWCLTFVFFVDLFTSPFITAVHEAAPPVVSSVIARNLYEAGADSVPEKLKLPSDGFKWRKYGRKTVDGQGSH
jgi:hypothetical protein